MKRMWKAITVLVVSLGVVAGLSACTTAEKVDMSNVTAVVDVRTPAEFAEGHLEGAVNIDYESGHFADDITKLDPAGTYVLYCRSGNRAGKALAEMQAAGFAHLTNAGGYVDASAATGLPIVK